jgi:hypothetical protein
MSASRRACDADQSLGVDPQNPKIIKTVYGAGYMLSAAVSWS